MCGKRYTDEFKIEAVKQVTERGHSVADVAHRFHQTILRAHTRQRDSAVPRNVRR